MDLKADGEEQALTLGNIEEYVHLMTDFCLYSGIKKQMDAFRGTETLFSPFSEFLCCIDLPYTQDERIQRNWLE